jgi:hypothetical protein
LVVISQLKLLPLHRFLSCITVLVVVLLSACGQDAFGQVTIKGTVFNMYRTRPLEAVSVTSTSGKGTITDSNGNYSLVVREQDSISFSYLGRSTVKYPVSAINTANNFDIALHVNPTELKEVRVAPKNYHRDSVQNRLDYAKVFDFKKPGLTITSPGQGLGVGFDLDEIINAFRFKRTRRLLAFQRRLLEEEQDKYIDHRFNRSIIKKITQEKDDKILDSFMVKYRPSYEFTETTSDYEFYDYIKIAYREFKDLRTGELRKEDN